VRERVGHMYPTTTDGAEPIVYFWARTVTCPNPACRVSVPLVGQWIASSRKGSEAFFVPYLASDNGFDVRIVQGKADVPDGTMKRNGATCPSCDSAVALDYVKGRVSRGACRPDCWPYRFAKDGRGRLFRRMTGNAAPHAMSLRSMRASSMPSCPPTANTWRLRGTA
jgi:hypothetical protein